MQECVFAQKCPIFNKFRNEAVKDFWISHYCQRDAGERCARKRLRDQGKSAAEVPITLLPNGMHLPDLQDVEKDWDTRTGDACSHLGECAAMFRRFRDPESKVFFGRRYCLIKEGQGCQRKRLMDEGKFPEHVPVTMLPNGEHLETLSDEFNRIGG
ncbi:MAG: hypothetical protein WBG50_04215 [Desulfomonilaceae bacterium]